MQRMIPLPSLESLKAGNKSSTWKVPFLYWELERYCYHQRQDSGPRSLHSCYFFIKSLPKSKLCLNSVLIKHPNLFLCPVTPSQIYCFFVYKVKAICFGHFLGCISLRPLCTQIKFFFFSCKSVLCQCYDWSSRRNSREEQRGASPLSDGRTSTSCSHIHTSIVWSTAVSQITPLQKAFPS